MNFGIALGSNLGDRLQCCREAMERLFGTVPSVRLLAVAPLYETEPVDCPADSMSFYNTVVEVAADVEPLALLAVLRAIEAASGRPNAHAHHAPRTVDLDVLYAGDIALSLPELTVPHPRLTQRRFVLQPLADIRPDLLLPGQTKTIRELLSGLRSAERPPKLVQRDWLVFAK